MNDRTQFIESEAQNADRLSFMEAQKVYIEFGEIVNNRRTVKPGQASHVFRDELGWIVGVQTSQDFCLDKEFPTLREALDFAMETHGL